MQAHEFFLIVIYKGLRMHRLECFIDDCVQGFFELHVHESKQDFLRCVDDAYVEFCQRWELSEDIPSKVCAFFLKDMEAYL